MSTIDHPAAAVNPAPTFQQALAFWANLLGDDPDPTTAWIGRQVGLLHDRAAYLGATGPDDFEDRQLAERDAYNDARSGRT